MCLVLFPGKSDGFAFRFRASGVAALHELCACRGETRAARRVAPEMYTGRVKGWREGGVRFTWEREIWVEMGGDGGYWWCV